MKKQMTKLLFLSLTLGLSSCGVNLEKGDLIFSAPKGSIIEDIEVDPDQESNAQFINLQKKLFEPSCLKCHGPNQRRRINLSSKEVIIENYDEIVYKMTKAFDEDNDPMPPIRKGTRVSAELIQELQKWKESL